MNTTTLPFAPRGHINLRPDYRPVRSDQRDYEAMREIALTSLICFNVALYTVLLIWWLV